MILLLLFGCNIKYKYTSQPGVGVKTGQRYSWDKQKRNFGIPSLYIEITYWVLDIY